eukprot:Filipodium_phascolosomae@DN7134_c0_g1_i1.p1
MGLFEVCDTGVVEVVMTHMWEEWAEKLTPGDIEDTKALLTKDCVYWDDVPEIVQEEIYGISLAKINATRYTLIAGMGVGAMSLLVATVMLIAGTQGKEVFILLISSSVSVLGQFVGVAVAAYVFYDSHTHITTLKVWGNKVNINFGMSFVVAMCSPAAGIATLLTAIITVQMTNKAQKLQQKEEETPLMAPSHHHPQRLPPPNYGGGYGPGFGQFPPNQYPPPMHQMYPGQQPGPPPGGWMPWQQPGPIGTNDPSRPVPPPPPRPVYPPPYQPMQGGVNAPPPQPPQ